MSSDGRTCRRTLGLTENNRIAVIVFSSLIVSIVCIRLASDTGTRSSLPAVDEVALCLDINSASADELILLPGVGEKLAALIVKERSSGGPFSEINDLARVRGIGPSLIERITPYAECR